MKVYFRVDASVDIGTGHVIRCLSLAYQLRESGHDIAFVLRPQFGDLSVHIDQLGYKIFKMAPLKSLKIPSSTADYKSWLQVTEIQDAEEFSSMASDAEVVVVDHYGINLAWEEFVTSRIGCKLIVIDDLARRHSADLIIDQTYGADPNEYSSQSGVSDILAGSEYALLNSQFSVLHKLAVKQRETVKKHKLMISMGGVDKPNVSLSVLEALSTRPKQFNTTVLLSERAPHFKLVSSFCRGNEDWIKHIRFTGNMADLMLEHTLAIGAPGSTSWERACLGLPSILIPLAENQIKICRSLVNAGCVISLRKEKIEDELNLKLDKLLSNYQEMTRNNLKICDGMGALRAANKINDLVRL